MRPAQVVVREPTEEADDFVLRMIRLAHIATRWGISHEYAEAKGLKVITPVTASTKYQRHTCPVTTTQPKPVYAVVQGAG